MDNLSTAEHRQHNPVQFDFTADMNAPYLMIASVEAAILTQNFPSTTTGVLALVNTTDDDGKMRLVVAAKMLWN